MNDHVAVWIDHQQAHIFSLDTKTADKTKVLARLHHLHHEHRHGAEEGKKHPDDTKRFFHDVDRALDHARAILLVGPGVAKLQFLRYAREHDHALEGRIVGLETVDHPTDAQLVAFARSYFDLGAARSPKTH